MYDDGDTEDLIRDNVQLYQKNYNTWRLKSGNRGAQSKFVGLPIRRFFPGHGWFNGWVKKCFLRHQGGSAEDLWHVTYEDGDEEDLIQSQVEDGRKAYIDWEAGGRSSNDDGKNGKKKPHDQRCNVWLCVVPSPDRLHIFAEPQIGSGDTGILYDENPAIELARKGRWLKVAAWAELPASNDGRKGFVTGWVPIEDVEGKMMEHTHMTTHFKAAKKSAEELQACLKQVPVLMPA